MEFQYDLSPFIAFRDRAECERVRAIRKADIMKHPNPDFKISVIEEPVDLFGALATDLVFNIQQALAEGRQFVCILPVGPTAQYPVAARMINRLRIPMHHVHTFNMDEYADQDGKTAPASWAGSFQKAMMDTFFGLIDSDLRPPMAQVHFPSSENINDYGKMLETWGMPTSVTAASAGAATSRSGRRTWAMSSGMTSKPTCRPARASCPSRR